MFCNIFLHFQSEVEQSDQGVRSRISRGQCSFTPMRNIESNTGKSARQGNLTRASCKQCELFPLHVNKKSSSVFLCIA